MSSHSLHRWATLDGMTTTPLVIIGAGGFGREVLDVLDAVKLHWGTVENGDYEFVGFLDDGTPDLDLLSARGVDHLGSVAHLEDLPENVGYLIGIGDGAIRRQIDSYGQSLGRPSPTVVHPSATVGFDVRFGPGTVVCSHVSLTNNIRVGRHVHLNLNSTVGHDAVLGDYVTVSPLVAVSGEVTIGDEVLLGTGAAINQRLNIGAAATVGAGAAVVKDIPAGTVAVGVPAKPRG